MSREVQMSSEKQSRRGVSCAPYFDALWFCYSPVHQMQQYYRLGALDNCSQKWSGLVDCLTLKTKRSSEVEEILETREKAKPHLWSTRTPEEAAAHWRELFDHLDEEKILHAFQLFWSRWFTSLDHVVSTSFDDLDHPTMQEKQVSHA